MVFKQVFAVLKVMLNAVYLLLYTAANNWNFHWFFFSLIKLRLETSDQLSTGENTDEKPQDTKTSPREQKSSELHLFKTNILLD